MFQGYEGSEWGTLKCRAQESFLDFLALSFIVKFVAPRGACLHVAFSWYFCCRKYSAPHFTGKQIYWLFRCECFRLTF